MTLKDVLGLMQKAPPSVNPKNIDLRIVARVGTTNPELKKAFNRLHEALPKSHRGKWVYCHTTLVGVTWLHVFEHAQRGTVKLVSCQCKESEINEINIITGYALNGDAVAQAARYWPRTGRVRMWPRGTAQYHSVAGRMLSMQTRKIKNLAEILAKG